MATESAIFTALPNGVHESGDFLCVTVFVSPRLSTDGAGRVPLAGGAFPAFEDWPAALADTKWQVLFDGVGALDAEDDPDSTPPESATWHLLFDACEVRDGSFTNLAERRIRSVPVGQVAESVLGLYTEVAETFPSAFPPVTTGPLADLGRELGLLGHTHRNYPQLEKYFEREPPHGQKGRYLDRTLIPPGDRERMAFLETYRFYDRPGSRDPLGEDVIPPEPEVEKFDFHQFVAFCGDYPKLLRPLGLAIDLLVRRDPAIPPQGRIRVRVDSSPPLGPWVNAAKNRPRTRYEIAERRFLAEPRFKEGDLVDGTLRLENPRAFLVNQFDVDGSALKTVDFAGNVRRLMDDLQAKTRSLIENASSLPALRTGGFTIARDARAERVVGQLDTAADLEAQHAGNTAAELFAEDVTRGYRLDVEDSGRPDRWRSLHHRTGRYRVEPAGGGAPVPLPIEPDEGYVKGASAASVPADADQDLYVHEALFGWEGWSLAAKRPGQAITQLGAEPIEPRNETDLPLFTEFEATSGTLPRLRFGRTYRFRARAVDLAGNSVREEDVVPHHASRPQTFRRFEPVPAPAVIPRRPFTEGESLLRMVIRSTLGVSPSAYVALSRIVGLDGHTDPLLAYRAENERHLAPPISSEQLAEWHGKFDDGFGVSAAQAEIDEQFDVASLESGSFLQPSPDASVFNPDPTATPTDLADPDRKKGDPLKPGEYILYDTDDLALPYLPDPLSLGASFTTLPGEAATRLQKWEAGPEWYDRRPLRIRIEDGAGAPEYDDEARVLTVFLPQAEMVTVHLSSFMDPGDLELMAVWMLERPFVRAAQQALARQGRHWLLTPWEPLTLVHAVEKPLTPPVVNVPANGMKRSVGETFAVLEGTVENHAKSTGRLDVDARWTEPIDDLAQEGPSEIDGRAHVGDFQLVASEDHCRTGRDDVPAAGAQPPVHKLRHEFRDTKHRYVTYRATATTRFREYFPPEISNDRSLITHEGPEVERNVPSSRRPEPPEVLYVVPTWTWDERTVRGVAVAARKRRPPSTFLRTRSGGGLRVYLDRPWYSSGADELLGVVLEAQPWITWPFDVGAGLAVPAVARALADEFAGRVLAEGLVKPGGRASMPDSQRLISGVLRIRPRPARPRKSGDAAAEAFELLADAELSAEPEAEALGAARFTKPQLDVLEDMLGKFLLPSGDPQRFVTHWGLDPIWGSAPVHAGPYIHQFPLRAAVGTGISLLEAPGHVVTVVGHEPKFDTDRKLWYCDLQLDAGASYFPFVRLALARYQPHSIPGQHLSAVVFPDFAQLVAERTSAVTRIGRSAVALSLRGPAGYSEKSEQLLPFFRPDDLQQLLSLSRFAVAQVERLPAESTTDLAWIPVGDEVRLDLSAARGVADVSYFGTIPLPPREAGDQLRVSLREYEIFETDESEADEHFIRPLAITDFVFRRHPVRYRLVYADHLAL